MKTNWQRKKLGDLILDIKDGGTPSRKKLEYFGGNVSWCVVKDIKPQIFSTKENLTESGLKHSSAKLWPVGSIIISLGATIGQVGVAKIPVATKQGISGMIVDNSLVLTEYLVYVLNSKKEFIQSIAKGTTIKEVRPTALKEKLLVPFPPLPEQKHIVKILDEAFEKIEKAKENTEKNLQNAKELFESYLQNVFANPGKGWEEKRLEELGQITSSKRIYKKEYVEDGIPFYRIKEIKELAHNKDITLELFISENRYNEIKNAFGIPKAGDILMTAVGTIGEIYVVKKDEKFYFKDGNILWFKNFDSIDPYFLKFVLMSFVEQINKLSIGSAYNALTIEKIEKHKIFFPKSISEQKTIVKKLDSLSEQTKKLEEIYKQKLADLEELKKSILNRAFSGEL